MQANLYRVFFHELGHFVAKEINMMNGIGSGTSGIRIIPDLYVSGEFHGETDANIPEGTDTSEVAPKERLAAHLASLMYGCMFQCYRDNISINSCIRDYAESDASNRRNSLTAHSLEDQLSAFTEIEDAYFNSLACNRCLDEFMNLNPTDFLKGCEGGYVIELDKLRTATENLIAAHRSVYQQLINQYNALIYE